MPSLIPLDGLPPGRRGWAATAQLLGVAMSTLDLAIANTALPTIAGNLHTNPEASIWIINAYQLALIATALPFATLGDIVGHKRIFLYGLVVFTAASLACACSDSARHPDHCPCVPGARRQRHDERQFRRHPLHLSAG